MADLEKRDELDSYGIEIEEKKSKEQASRLREVSHVELVTNPYDRADSACRKGAMVSGTWDAQTEAFVREHDVRALYFNTARGWQERDFSFLSGLDFIEELHVVCGQIENLAAIEGMSALEEVSLSGSAKGRVQFDKLEQLRSCFLSWWKGAGSIFGCRNLARLHLAKAPDLSRDQFRGLAKLRSLELSCGRMSDVEFLLELPELLVFEMHDCRKVTDLGPVGRCLQLKRLMIRGNKHLTHLDFASGLNELEVLVVSDSGEIESLAPLKSLKHLKAFSFAGTRTRVMDGDLSVLCELPKLSMLMFAPRRNYTHKLVKRWNWNNFDKPDRLLVER